MLQTLTGRDRLSDVCIFTVPLAVFISGTQTECKAKSVSGISSTFGSYMLLRSNICLTARLVNGILISDNSLSYHQPHWKLRKVTGSTASPATSQHPYQGRILVSHQSLTEEIIRKKRQTAAEDV